MSKSKDHYSLLCAGLGFAGGILSITCVAFMTGYPGIDGDRLLWWQTAAAVFQAVVLPTSVFVAWRALAQTQKARLSDTERRRYAAAVALEEPISNLRSALVPISVILGLLKAATTQEADHIRSVGKNTLADRVEDCSRCLETAQKAFQSEAHSLGAERSKIALVLAECRTLLSSIHYGWPYESEAHFLKLEADYLRAEEIFLRLKSLSLTLGAVAFSQTSTNM